MNIKFSPAPDGKPLYLIDLDIDRKIIEELKDENWVPITPTHLDDYYTKRNRIDGSLKGSIVNELSKYIHSNKFKKIILDLVWKDIIFQHKWGPRLNYEKIDNITKTEFSYSKDIPGFSTDFHLENRSQIAFGMIYFMEHDDPKCSTYFYQNELREHEFRIPTGLGKGWLCINTHWGWHEGWNKSDNDRFSSSLNLCFDMFNSGVVQPNDATLQYIRGESTQI